MTCPMTVMGPVMYSITRVILTTHVRIRKILLAHVNTGMRPMARKMTKMIPTT